MLIKTFQDFIDKLRGKDKLLAIREIFKTVKENNRLLKENRRMIMQESQRINNSLLQLFYIYLPAMEVHSKVFPKYKSIYKDESLVLVASGPTLNYYERVKGLIHIGVNHTISKENIDLDYLFVQDYLGEQQEITNNYRKNICKKFYGYHCYEGGLRETDVDETNAERYYFIDQIPPTSYLQLANPNILTRPLNTWSSVIFPALEFALWTHPKKIHLVGCDSTANGHYYYKDVDPNVSFPPNCNVKYGWEMMQIYIRNHYPDVEIISVNPVGLKGMFKDVYTENYLKDHPEIDRNSAEIIKV